MNKQDEGDEMLLKNYDDVFAKEMLRDSMVEEMTLSAANDMEIDPAEYERATQRKVDEGRADGRELDRRAWSEEGLSAIIWYTATCRLVPLTIAACWAGRGHRLV
eukprot:1327976-Heterocapsa_arctica.AAC.1